MLECFGVLSAATERTIINVECAKRNATAAAYPTARQAESSRKGRGRLPQAGVRTNSAEHWPIYRQQMDHIVRTSNTGARRHDTTDLELGLQQ